MPDNARQTLIDLVARFGHGLSEDPKRCEGLLRDVCFDQKKEILILVTAIKEGVPQELLRLQKSIPQTALLDRCAQRLHETTGFMEEFSNWAVTSWALALGVIQSEDASNMWLLPNIQPINPSVFPSEIVVSIGLKLRLIPEGFFMRGEGSESHSVTLSKPFYLGVYPVTQQQYKKVMGRNPSFFQGSQEKKVYRAFISSADVDGQNADLPVESVSWADAVEFCKRLSKLPLEKQAGRVYRLPTEAEWEYACRAGTKTVFSFGDSYESLGDYAWYDENSNHQTHPVGKKKPNAWGLYDMHGNVWEWCRDWYGEYAKNAVVDPSGSYRGVYRVRRGGSWGSDVTGCQTASRSGDTPASRRTSYGFRVALSSSGVPQSSEADK
jgi:formylglycine-generating enzyme required for sulfatase activity